MINDNSKTISFFSHIEINILIKTFEFFWSLCFGLIKLCFKNLESNSCVSALQQWKCLTLVKLFSQKSRVCHIITAIMALP